MTETSILLVAAAIGQYYVHMVNHLKSLAFAGILTVVLSGCTQNNDYMVKAFNEHIGKRIGIELTQRGSTPVPKLNAKKEAPVETDHRTINGEFVKELFHVVLRRDLHNEDEFTKYMNIMDQGGHYEGIYNGIVHSLEYKEREKGVAPVSALKTYAEIMAQITLDQRYDPIQIHKTEKVEPPQPTDNERAQLISEFERSGLNQSFFTLKRKLGDELLKTIELKREYKEKFATWYGRFTAYMIGFGTDFGIEQRNKKDEYYHYKWALDADEDRLKWECLNRIHVVMNAQVR